MSRFVIERLMPARTSAIYEQGRAQNPWNYARWCPFIDGLPVEEPSSFPSFEAADAQIEVICDNDLAQAWRFRIVKVED